MIEKYVVKVNNKNQINRENTNEISESIHFNSSYFSISQRSKN
jgi:hypothetical protein